MSVNEKILEKIKNLLSLAEDGNNDEESQTALLMAQKLMLKYKISHQELSENDKNEIVIRSLSIYKRVYWWEKVLVQIIADNFRVMFYVQSNRLPHQKSVQRKLVLMGFLVACDHSLKRLDRTLDLVQENVTAIVNNLGQIQSAEGKIQESFEATLKMNEDLSSFNNPEAPIFVNLSQRRDQIEQLSKQGEELTKLMSELDHQRKDLKESKEEVDKLYDQLSRLSGDLNKYLEDYKNNLALESETYKSIAAGSVDYSNFFSVFDNVNKLYTFNQMNLEKVIQQFEPINAHLINFKVYITNLQENS